jgi:acyl phosphate:glycerol-3-phosphate acyltransferase
MSTYIIVAVIAYLLGSIPFGYILVRLFRKQDVRTLGSGNIGATNVARSGAKGLGMVTLILDAAKGYAAVMVGITICRASIETLFKLKLPVDSAQLGHLREAHLQRLYIAAAIAAVFAILGHMYPVWLKFKGGKGVATGVGVFLALAPAAVGLVLVIFVAIVWFSRYVSLGSIIATAAFPILAWVLYRNSKAPVVFLAAAFAAFMIIAKHHQNIRRLLAGTEHRLGEKKQVQV